MNGDGREGKTRKVLAVGIPLHPQEDEGPPELDALDPLDDAIVHAATVSRALSGFGYMECERPDQDWDPARGIPGALKTRETGLLVIHIVAHGKIAPAGERGLHVIGGDGEAFDEPVSNWINFVESDPGKPRPTTLFILDLCYSGAAASLPWHQEMLTEQRRAWVIAATGREDLAFDYRLSRAVATVLNGYHDGTRSVDSSVEYIPLGDVAQEIKREVAALSRGGHPQNVEISRAPLGEKADHLVFFRNPRYQQAGVSVLSGVDECIAPLLDDVFDPRHFMSRGAGTEALGLGLGQGYFRGRKAEVDVLARWFSGQGPALQVVTGKPGVGKSALLGVLVCAAHPELRDSTRPLWSSLSRKPARNDRLAVVHARRRTLEEIADALARQMGAAEAARPAAGWDAEGIARLATREPHARYALVIDALDEADRPEDVNRALLMPLAQTVQADGGAAVRMLIGTRREPRFASLLELAEANGGLTDLDQSGPGDLHQALLEYVNDLLASDTTYSGLATHAAGEALAEGIAAGLTGVMDPAGSPVAERPLGWGEFLVAGLYLRHVLSLPVEHDPARARQVGLAVPLSLPELLELDLARRGGQSWLRPVMSALAHVEGVGMPERVIAHVAPRLRRRGQHDGGLVPPEDLRLALDQARFYLRRDIDTNATTLYRLFHEGLAEYLRANPYGSAQEGAA